MAVYCVLRSWLLVPTSPPTPFWYRRDETPVDEALRRDYSDIMELINSFSAPGTDVTDTKGVDEFDEEEEANEPSAPAAQE